MNPYSVLPLFGAFVALFFGLWIYLQESKSPTSRLFLVVSLVVAYLLFATSVYRDVDSPAVADVWLRLASPWPFMFAVTFHFAIVFVGAIDTRPYRVAVGAAYLSAIGLSIVLVFTDQIVQGSVLEWWGWAPERNEGSVALVVSSVWVFVMAIATLGVVIRLRMKSQDDQFRAQTRYLIVGYAIPIVVILVTLGIFPLAGVPIPDISPPFFTVGVGFFAYGLKRHRLFVINTRTVSREIVETMSDAVLLVDANRRVVSVNSAGTRLLELDRAEVVGRPIARFLPGELPTLTGLQRASPGLPTGSETEDTVLTTGSGDELTVSLAVTPLLSDEGHEAGAVLVARDISQRKSMEARVATLEEQRKEQALREATEGERKRLAEELHDQTLQELAGLAIEIGFVQREAAGADAANYESVQTQLTSIRSRVRGTESGLRDIVRGLYPDVLTNLGLLPAIRSFLDGVVALPLDGVSPVTIHLTSSGFGDDRPGQLAELTAYRLVQQSTFNAIPHGNPASLDIAIAWKDDHISVEVSDDGAGFEPVDLARLRAAGHHGIANLYDRVGAAGGRIAIETAPGKGTRVHAVIPTGEVRGVDGSPERATYKAVPRA